MGGWDNVQRCLMTNDEMKVKHVGGSRDGCRSGSGRVGWFIFLLGVVIDKTVV